MTLLERDRHSCKNTRLFSPGPVARCDSRKYNICTYIRHTRSRCARDVPGTCVARPFRTSRELSRIAELFIRPESPDVTLVHQTHR